MNFELVKSLLSLLFYTFNPYFFTTFSKFVSLLFPYFFVEEHLKACQTYLQWVQSPQFVYRGFNCYFQRKLYFLVPKGSNILQGWGSNSIAFKFPRELVNFKVSPGHLPPPPPPPPPPPQPPLLVRA